MNDATRTLPTPITQQGALVFPCSGSLRFDIDRRKRCLHTTGAFMSGNGTQAFESRFETGDGMVMMLWVLERGLVSLAS